MEKCRRYVLGILLMGLVSMVSLLGVSVLTYWLKWQADKAMIGIIVTYILAGFSGGISLKLLNKEKMKLRRKGAEALIISNIFMIILLMISVIILKNPFEMSGRVLMIWGLVMSSAFLGRIL